LAPEVSLNITTIESDIWSFGMVLYKIMTLRSPYMNDNLNFVDTLKKHSEWYKARYRYD